MTRSPALAASRAYRPAAQTRGPAGKQPAAAVPAPGTPYTTTGHQTEHARPRGRNARSPRPGGQGESSQAAHLWCQRADTRRRQA